MKIVINTCYGGFGFSKKARDLLADRGFEHALASQQDDHTYGRFVSYNELVLNDKLTMEKVAFRMHPMIVGVVEELGEEANGDCSKLEVVEFSLEDIINIKNYDSNESLSFRKF